jgi:hypothetical protein
MERSSVSPAGVVAVAVAEAMGCSSPEAWKNVKCTTLFPGVPGSMYV